MDLCSISSCFSRFQSSYFIFLSLLLIGSVVAETFVSLMSAIRVCGKETGY